LESLLLTALVLLILAVTIAAPLMLRYIRHHRSEVLRAKLATEHLLKNIDTIAALTDGTGVIESTSERFDKAFLSGNSCKPGETIFPFLSKKHGHNYTNILKYVASEKKPVVDFAMSFDAGGVERELALTVIPVLDPKKTIYCLIHIFRPPSQQKELEVDLRHIEKLTNIGQIAAGIAHELNTPLGSIILSADIIKDSGESNQVATEVDKIKSQAEHCSKVVKQVLGYVRKAEEVKDRYEFYRIVEKVRDLVDREARNRNIAISINTTPDETVVLCDESQIIQLFFNLFNNAYHAIGENGNIDIRIGRDALLNQVVVAFSDDGRGIPGENVDKIFDPFFTTKPGTEGTGLGLALCKKIVLEHGGRIEVDTTVGKGTTFKLCFPVAP
jgi:signal transduction histidine kinase